MVEFLLDAREKQKGDALGRRQPAVLVGLADVGGGRPGRFDRGRPRADCRDTVITERKRRAGRATASASPIPGATPSGRRTSISSCWNAACAIPPSAGSGSGEAPNPVGYDRVYVHVDGELSYEKWWQAFRAGRVVVTNGPLLKPLGRRRVARPRLSGREGRQTGF